MWMGMLFILASIFWAVDLFKFLRGEKLSNGTVGMALLISTITFLFLGLSRLGF